MTTVHRYANGNTREQQARADREYRNRQRNMRTWVDQVAEALGVGRDQLLTAGNAELVADLLKTHHPGPEPPGRS